MKDIGLLALVVFLTHGLLLLMDGIYYEDWIIVESVREGWPVLQAWYAMWGRSAYAYVYWIMHQLPNSLIFYRLFSFLMLFGTTVGVYYLCEASKALSKRESFWTALLFATSSPVKVWPFFGTIIYILATFLFVIAALMAVRAWLPETPYGRKVLRPAGRIISLAAFYVSFYLESLLVFYSAFLIYWFLLCEREKSRFSNLSKQVLHFGMKRIDYLLLPLVFYVVKVVYFSPDAGHSDYNQFILTPLSLIKNLLEHIHYPVFREYHNALMTALRNPVVYGLLALLMVRYSSISEPDAKKREGLASTTLILAFAGVLFFLAIIPYVIVGKSPYMEADLSSRHSVLTAVPTSLACVVLSRMIPDKRGAPLRTAVLSLLLAGFMIASNSNYLIWQARWVKNLSALHNLSKDATARSFTKYVIIDHFKTGARQDELSEWRLIFQREWGKGEQDIFYVEDALADFEGSAAWRDTLGPGAVVQVYQGQYEDARYAAFKYMFYRLASERRLEQLLDTFTRVEIMKLDSPNG